MSENTDLDLNKLSINENIKEKKDLENDIDSFDHKLFSNNNSLLKQVTKQPENSMKKSTLCSLCNKKLGLIPFKCKCNDVFCDKHRYSFLHNCKFDFRKENKDKLKNSLQKIVADKIDKI